MPNSHPNLLKSCTLEVGILSSVLFEAPSLSGVNVCICCGLDLRYLLVAHMLKASAPAWSTREELGYRQEVGPNGSPVIPLEGTPSQSPLAVPLLGLHCLLGKPQPRLGPVESTGVLGREEEKEKLRGVDRERPEMPGSTCHWSAAWERGLWVSPWGLILTVLMWEDPP